MALERLDYPASGTVTDSWAPTRNPSYGGAPWEKDMGVVREVSAGNKAYTYGAALWTYFIRRAYRGVLEATKADLENFAAVVGGDLFRFTDHQGVPWRVRFEDFRRVFQPSHGDRWDIEFTLRAELAPHPSLKKVPAAFRQNLLFYAPLTTSLETFSRWDGAATFTRATTATYRSSGNLLVTAASGATRHDYDSSAAARGVLLEGQRTNNFLRSEEFDNASWTKENTTITANSVAAPDNAVTADKIAEVTDVAQVHAVRQDPALTDNENYVVSVFATSAERTWLLITIRNKAANVFSAWYNLGAGTIGTVSGAATATIEPWANGFYRCAITYNAESGGGTPYHRIGPTTGDGVVTYDGAAGNGIRVWGAQHEQVASGEPLAPSSYIATTSGTATRNADVLTFASLGHFTNPGTVILVGDVRALSANGVFVSIDDGTINNRIVILAAGSPLRPEFDVVSGGVTQAAIIAAGGGDDFAAATEKKLSGAYATNDFELVSSSASRGTDVSGSVPGGQTTIRLGAQSNGVQLFGHVRDLMIFARRLSLADISTVMAGL